MPPLPPICRLHPGIVRPFGRMCCVTVLLVLCLPAIAGCSRRPTVPWGTAVGHATVDGQPITEGVVVFDNRELAVSRMAEIQPDGTFKQASMDFPGLPVGQYKVAFLPTKISKGDWVPIQQSKPQKPSPTIPERYFKVETSGLTAEVKEGQNCAVRFRTDALKQVGSSNTEASNRRWPAWDQGTDVPRSVLRGTTIQLPPVARSRRPGNALP